MKNHKYTLKWGKSGDDVYYGLPIIRDVDAVSVVVWDQIETEICANIQYHLRGVGKN